MNSDDEMTHYLRLLLDHSKQCADETCPSHARLYEICNLIRERIFSGPGSTHLPAATGAMRDMRIRAALGKS